MSKLTQPLKHEDYKKYRGRGAPGTKVWLPFHVFWICFLVSSKGNEMITGLGVFLPLKRRKLRASLGVRQITAEGEEEKRRRKEEEKKKV